MLVRSTLRPHLSILLVGVVRFPVCLLKFIFLSVRDNFKIIWISQMANLGTSAMEDTTGVIHLFSLPLSHLSLSLTVI